MVADQTRLYVRDLPGGGYVAIDLVADALPEQGMPCRAHGAVELRTTHNRRAGDGPPVIAEAKGETRSQVFGELFRVACDNVAGARGLLRWNKGMRDFGGVAV